MWVCINVWVGGCARALVHVCVGLLDYGKKIIITIILVNIEIMIIQTIIFEFENMMYLFCMPLLKTLFN